MIYAVQSILDYKEIEETDTVKTHNVLKLYCFDTSINTLCSVLVIEVNSEIM